MKKSSCPIANEAEKIPSSLVNLSDLALLKDEIVDICKTHQFNVVIVYYRDDIGYDEGETVDERQEPIRLFIGDSNQPYRGSANRKILLERQLSLKQALAEFFSCHFDLTIAKLPETYPQCNLTDLNEEEAMRIFPCSADMKSINYTFTQRYIEPNEIGKKQKVNHTNSKSDNSSFGQSINMYRESQSRISTNFASPGKLLPSG